MSTPKKPAAGARLKKSLTVAIVQSLYHAHLTDLLRESCVRELVAGGIKPADIRILKVPGAFELPYGCQKMARQKGVRGVIALGVVIRGETIHFDLIATETAHGIMEVGLKNGLPVIFGVLTTENEGQAKDRCRGGKAGDKGAEAARSLLQLLHS